MLRSFRSKNNTGKNACATKSLFLCLGGTDDRLMSSVIFRRQGRKTTLTRCKHERPRKAKIWRNLAFWPSVFREISRAAGPGQQTTKNDGPAHQESSAVLYRNQLPNSPFISAATF